MTSSSSTSDQILRFARKGAQRNAAACMTLAALSAITYIPYADVLSVAERYFCLAGIASCALLAFLSARRGAQLGRIPALVELRSHPGCVVRIVTEHNAVRVLLQSGLEYRFAAGAKDRVRLVELLMAHSPSADATAAA